MNGNSVNNADKLERKPSIRNKKPPEIRHTLTSKYRMLKANPLLMNELEKVAFNNNVASKEAILLNKPLKTLVDIFDGKTPSLNVTAEKSITIAKPPPRKIEIFSKPKTYFNHSNTSNIDFGDGQILSSTFIESKGKATLKKSNNRMLQAAKKVEPVRRSLSAQRFDRKKFNSSVSFQNAKTTSMEQLPCTPSCEKPTNHSIIAEESMTLTSEPVLFKTPNTTKTSSQKSLFLSTPTPDDMVARLNTWLKGRGKSLGDYHHLQCFGVRNHKPKPVVDEENKENVTTNLVTSESYEDLRIVVEKPPEDNLENVAKEALQDLHKLILHGYPNEQCEIWLKVIKGKYAYLEEEPIYWECRAALEQSKGNINSAVECYKTAIVQGAEVDAVDKSLDQLLQKFSLLSIDREINKPKDKERSRIVEDARNVFKSSIIKFAVQERILKKKNKEGTVLERKLIATPVRRSTRLSRTKFTSTPSIKVYSTLQEAENDSIDINFKTNKALKN